MRCADKWIEAQERHRLILPYAAFLAGSAPSCADLRRSPQDNLWRVSSWRTPALPFAHDEEPTLRYGT